MELRQLRYFVKVCELGSMGRAALELGVVTSALSQQISRLEGELSTRLLQRSSTGVLPTDAGVAFLHQAQLTLRHADEAVRAAQQARLAGHVSVGLPPTTASVLGVPLMQAMRARYPDVRLHLVESLSGHLAGMLQARQLDLAMLFETSQPPRCSMLPLLDERLFAIAARGQAPWPAGQEITLAQLATVPLILPSARHGLRSALEAAFAHVGVRPRVVAEIDGLALLMDAVRAGEGATIQPGAAIARLAGDGLTSNAIADEHVGRRNLLVSLSDDELAPAALATRVVLADTVRTLVQAGRWAGARLLEN
ncbi:LysR substrate-binding domain-containing protein [Pseudorhodoferax sp. Leaf267]|uniref:LysR family transcriptional regulator n=1 Tax=Pseudorhodoferax sp. Leaf267 TaxID=1736316 RepID=UPI0006F7F9AD|nr:LysR substrate-binding domain-containing protein [Pseudorhodoferax sp. Leaf267]KQP17704.1 LysR family transcriptional regulator [Pseudorhodoferax sp. Leaf267]